MINKTWKWLRVDGLLHIETSARIAVLFGLFLPWWAAGLVAIAFGIGKEIYDRKKGGVAEMHDIWCDLIGTVGGMLILIIDML